jgi:hypothetical protein
VLETCSSGRTGILRSRDKFEDESRRMQAIQKLMEMRVSSREGSMIGSSVFSKGGTAIQRERDRDSAVSFLEGSLSFVKSNLSEGSVLEEEEEGTKNESGFDLEGILEEDKEEEDQNRNRARVENNPIREAIETQEDEIEIRQPEKSWEDEDSFYDAIDEEESNFELYLSQF